MKTVNIEATSIPKPQRRRWFQFSLRTMMILILFLSLPLGRFAYNLRQAREQEVAVAAIKTLGGDVGEAGPDPFGDLEPVWLPCVRHVLGDDIFNPVTVVSLRDTQVNDARLRQLDGHLKRLSHLRKLDLHGTQISDIPNPLELVPPAR